MQNRTDSRIPHFSIPQTKWTFPLHDITIKVAKCTKYEIKACNFFRFVVYSQYFKFSFNLYELTCEILVVNCCNQNMAVLTQ